MNNRKMMDLLQKEAGVGSILLIKEKNPLYLAEGEQPGKEKTSFWVVFRTSIIDRYGNPSGLLIAPVCDPSSTVKKPQSVIWLNDSFLSEETNEVISLIAAWASVLSVRTMYKLVEIYSKNSIAIKTFTEADAQMPGTQPAVKEMMEAIYEYIDAMTATTLPDGKAGSEIRQGSVCSLQGYRRSI